MNFLVARANEVPGRSRLHLLQRLRKPVFFVLVVAAASTAPGTIRAQSDNERIRELERKLERSLQTIDELSNRVRELESRTPVRPGTAQPASAAPAAPPTAAAPAAPAGPVAPRIEERAESTPPPTASIAPLMPPTTLRGFADVGAGYSGNGGNKGFVDGSLDFYLTPQLSERVKALVELVFEHEAEGSLETDLERLQVGYTFNSAFTLWLGRFHTPFGYWNTAFHHGQQLQTSILRPQMIDFEDRGGVVPAHTVGLWGTGATRAGDGKLTYDLYVGNSPSIKDGELDPVNSGKPHPGSSVGFNLGYLFGGNPQGLKIGVHGYRADIRDDTLVANATRLNILGPYAALDSETWEVIAEYYGFRNQDLSGGAGRFRSWTGFVQAGRHFDRWTPYGRLERAVLDQADNYFAALASGRTYTRQALGLRYDLTPGSALKLELNHTTLESVPAANFDQLLVQWAIRF